MPFLLQRLGSSFCFIFPILTIENITSICFPKHDIIIWRLRGPNFFSIFYCIISGENYVMFFPNLWINNSICIVITARCKNIPLLHSTSVLTSLYIEDNISVNKHRFRDVVTLATYHVSASLIGNTFTLTAGANINTNKSFQPDFKSGLLALLSRF